ncbi:hypothetical protein RJ639_026501 [Escallonia herrerae]|uniref:Reverse transcriptase Ty1/copia-type domain-containing protein n=1 Tax=Escallonia herrerae TaxID=1293975 RepID=A0AA88US91_9ASTE|nr:hypothetical protein RJ639_026501 [Escallonia herrerae]
MTFSFRRARRTRRIRFGSKNKEEDSSVEKGGNSHTKKPITCFRCRKTRHIKKNCRVKLSKANVTCTSEGDDQLKWDHCFTVETIEQKSTQAFVNYADNKEEWIIDSVLVPQITDSGKYVLFGPKDVKVLENVKEISIDVIFSCEKKGSLFVMSAGEVYVKKTSQTDNAAIWHARLGHVGYQLLQQISSKKFVDANVQAPSNVEAENESPAQNIARREDEQQAVRRSTRETKQLDYLKDYEVELNSCSVTSCFSTGALTAEEPTSYEEARGCPNCKRAMQEEIDALDKNGTWELVPKPEKCEPITCKWVFRLKKNSDSTIDRFKARLVALGFSQNYGLDYEETFSLVAKIVTFRSIISLAAFKVENLDQGYLVSQRAYAKSLLECFSMGESKEKATPMEPNLKLKKDKGKPLKSARKFRQLVGSLIYLTITRLEISYSVSVVSQFMQNPRTPHLEAARRILHYVKGTLNYGLLYKRCDNFVLSAFTDTDWAGDTNDRHSTSGYYFNTGSAAVSWCSKKQDIVILSSTEECVWLKRLIGDMFCEVDYAVQINVTKFIAKREACSRSGLGLFVSGKHGVTSGDICGEWISGTKSLNRGSNDEIVQVRTSEMGRHDEDFLGVQVPWRSNGHQNKEVSNVRLLRQKEEALVVKVVIDTFAHRPGLSVQGVGLRRTMR